MAILKQLWDNSEFADLNISTQNLRDQAARIEKSLGSAGATIREESNTANDLLQPNVDNQETKIWNRIIMNSTMTQFRHKICILRTRKSQRKMKRQLK